MSSTSSLEYARIQCVIESMSAVLNDADKLRILRAAECGGFDAALVSIRRITENIAWFHKNRTEQKAKLQLQQERLLVTRKRLKEDWKVVNRSLSRLSDTFCDERMYIKQMEKAERKPVRDKLFIALGVVEGRALQIARGIARDFDRRRSRNAQN